MKKTHKILLIDSRKRSIGGDRIRFNSKSKLLISSTPLSEATDHHLYIISDEEIKEGDWFIFNKQIHQASKSCDLQRVNEEAYGWTFKVIATTDKSLTIKCTHCDGSGTKLHEANSPYERPCGKCNSGKILLSQIPESFIQTYIKAYNEDKPITEVDLEYESPADFDNSIYSKVKLKTCPDNTVIIDIIQSKTYTRDEVINILNNFSENSVGILSKEYVNYWVNKYLV